MDREVCSNCQTRRRLSDHPIVEDETLSVIWGERRCYLGKSLGFRFLAHLASRPNQYVTYDSLFDGVWGGRRSNGAIRSVVRDLRRKLRRAGMSDLADAIDGSNHQCYGLILDRWES
ncbi:MAG: helix-turn-helix domain-containing protein [Phycisphaerales bacterium]|nr:helix-turn-helix domain-containing protein [Phycisphaerales bacterium]